MSEPFPPSGNNFIRDALHNLDPRTGSSPDYAKGILLAMVSVCMAHGLTFDIAARHVADFFPARIMPDAIPEAWKDHPAFRAALAFQIKPS